MKRLPALLAAVAAASCFAQPIEALRTLPVKVQAPTDVLRVCADPDNLPYSRADGSGFENRIARLLAVDLGVDLQFAWLPDRRGFVRKTLGAGDCDVIVGVPVGIERVTPTRPYYRSSYAWVQRAGAGQPPSGFDDPKLAGRRIGIQLIGDDQATSPPGFALARHAPQAHVVGFAIPGDKPAAQRIVEAIAAGELDAGIVWGPQAGYFAQRAAVPLQVVPMAAPPDLARIQPFAFEIAVGVRRGEDALRRRVDEALARHRAEIDTILAEYGVPRVEGTP